MLSAESHSPLSSSAALCVHSRHTFLYIKVKKKRKKYHLWETTASLKSVRLIEAILVHSITSIYEVEQIGFEE